MKKSILVISIGAIVSGVSVFALYSGEPKAAQKPAGPVPSVTVGLLAPEAINFAKTIAATGSVHARDELIIGSDASGVRLLEVLVDVGSSVRKGQLSRAPTMLSSRRSTRSRPPRSSRRGPSTRRRSRIRSAQSAWSGFSARRPSRRGARRRPLPRPRSSAIAQLAELQVRINQTRVYAPSSGVISRKTATVGAVVQPGNELFRLMRDAELEWRAELPSHSLAQIQTGAVARIVLDNGDAVHSVVRLVAPTMDSATRNGVVYVSLPRGTALKPGAHARGEILIEQAEGLDPRVGARHARRQRVRLYARWRKSAPHAGRARRAPARPRGDPRRPAIAGPRHRRGRRLRQGRRSRQNRRQIVIQNISAASIRKPIPAIVLFILLTFAGMLGFKKLGINQFPDVDIPYVTVSVTDTGAAPAEMETQVTRIIENSVATVGDVVHIMSTVSDGVSTTTVEFVFGKDIDRAVNDVRDAVTRVKSELPGSANEPVITRSTTTGGPMLTYTVKASGKTATELSWFVDNDISKTLLTIPGVGQVKRVGGVDREIAVTLKPERLAAYGITAAEVSRQLKSTNQDMPGGKATVGRMEQSIRTLGAAQTVATLRDMQITLRDGRAVRLSDLGSVEDSFAEPTQDAYVNGERAVAFQVLRAVGSSSVDVAKKVEAAIAKLSEEHKAFEIKLFTSTVDFTLESYWASVEALWLGALLAVVVVFFFLRDWRATLISAIAMPLSVIPTFYFMSWLGFTLNLITLLGLSLVVGILVDDAIVEVENIVRHIRMGKTPMQAALEAADEIGLAVVATTLTIVAVFIPVSFMSSVPGQFFRQFGISVAIAVLFSLAVARLLTPVMGAYFLKPHPETHTLACDERVSAPRRVGSCASQARSSRADCCSSPPRPSRHSSPRRSSRLPIAVRPSSISKWRPAHHSRKRSPPRSGRARSSLSMRKSPASSPRSALARNSTRSARRAPAKCAPAR